MRIAADDDLAAIVRAARGEAVTVVVDEDGDALALATRVAAIGPLAIERAPMRVNLVVVGGGAGAEDVAAAVAFLDTARSTTGQVLRVAQPRVRPHPPSCSSTKA